MPLTSFATTIAPDQEKISTKLILETAFSKEIQICLPAGQVMKEHQAPYPIIVHVLSGSIDFGVQQETHSLNSGDILSLAAKVPHDLRAKKDSIVRLSLAKADTADRVNEVVKTAKP